MRDMERIKPRYNVTLDNKQIVMIIISSIVILVLVFVIGFVLGRNAGTQEALHVQETARAGTPQNAVVFTQQTMQSVGQTAGEGQTKASTGPAGAGEQPTAAGVMTRTTTAEKHTELTFYKSLTGGAQHKEAAKKKEKKTVQRKAEKHKEMAKAIHAAAAGRFSIQCGAFRAREQAERLRSELKKKYGLSAWIEPIGINGEKVFRVRIGRFETRDKARAYQKRHLVPKGLTNCVITVGK